VAAMAHAPTDKYAVGTRLVTPNKYCNIELLDVPPIPDPKLQIGNVGVTLDFFPVVESRRCLSLHEAKA
jgi:hypothetical protein